MADIARPLTAVARWRPLAAISLATIIIAPQWSIIASILDGETVTTERFCLSTLHNELSPELTFVETPVETRLETLALEMIFPISAQFAVIFQCEIHAKMRITTTKNGTEKWPLKNGR